MKIIHTADIHICSAIKNLPKEKARQRRSEGLTALRYLCKYAQENQVSAVLICGDLFDESSVPQSVVKETFSVFSSAPDVLFFYCQGNHDKQAALIDDLPKNLLLFNDAHGWKSYDIGENITVTGIDGEYLTSEAYTRLRLLQTSYNIVMAHGELSTLCGKDRICLPLLQNKHIDYLALGHIHNPDRALQKLDARGSYRYSGCLFSRGFDECGQKGFYEIELKKGRILSEKLITIPTVRAVNAYLVDVSACQTAAQLESAVLSSLQNQRVDDVIKVVLKGSCLSSLKKHFYPLELLLNRQFFYCKLVDQTTPQMQQAERLQHSPILSEFARLIDSNAELGPQKEELLEIAFKALSGEELEI